MQKGARGTIHQVHAHRGTLTTCYLLPKSTQVSSSYLSAGKKGQKRHSIATEKHNTWLIRKLSLRWWGKRKKKIRYSSNKASCAFLFIIFPLPALQLQHKCRLSYLLVLACCFREIKCYSKFWNTVQKRFNSMSS